jgi:ATP-binding cassette, subfamily C, bacterial LapB
MEQRASFAKTGAGGPANLLLQMAFSHARMPIVLATLGSNLFAMALPLATLQLYDRVIPGKGYASLQVLAGALVVALLLDTLLRLGQGRMISWSAARFEHETGCAAVRSFLTAKPASIEAVSPGVHVQRLNAVERLREFAVHQGLVALVDLPFAFVFLGLIWLIAPPLFVVTLLFLALAFGGAWWTGSRLRRAVHDRAEVDDRRISFLLETLGAAHTIKGAAIETSILRRYERLIEQAAGSGYNTAFISGVAQTLGSVSAQTLGFGIVALGAVLVLDHQLTVGGLAACSLLAGRALQPLLRAVGVFTQLYAVSEAADRLREVLDLPAGRPVAAKAREPDSALLQLNGVCFGYTPERQLISNVCLRIEPGVAISIMSSTPGKSTLLRLAAGLLDPDSGDITLGGIPLSELSPRTIARNIGYVPQQTTLFRGSLMDNLTMFERDRGSIERATALSAELGLDAHVMRLAQGYDTMVDDEGVFLPRGVLQRLTIVRALVRSPRIVLFDDANTAFDHEADLQLRRLFHRLKQEGRALVLVSHRPSLLAMADHSYVLSNGQLLAAPCAATAMAGVA